MSERTHTKHSWVVVWLKIKNVSTRRRGAFKGATARPGCFYFSPSQGLSSGHARTPPASVRPPHSRASRRHQVLIYITAPAASNHGTGVRCPIEYSKRDAIQWGSRVGGSWDPDNTWRTKFVEPWRSGGSRGEGEQREFLNHSTLDLGNMISDTADQRLSALTLLTPST